MTEEGYASSEVSTATAASVDCGCFGAPRRREPSSSGHNQRRRTRRFFRRQQPEEADNASAATSTTTTTTTTTPLLDTVPDGRKLRVSRDDRRPNHQNGCGVFRTTFRSTGTRRYSRRSRGVLLGSLFLLSTMAVAVAADTNDAATAAPTAAILDKSWELLATHAHDPTSFTQGLEIHPSSFPKSTNNNNSSSCGGGGGDGPLILEDDSELEPDSLDGEDWNDDGGGIGCANASIEDDDTESSSTGPPPLLVLESTGMYGDSLVRIWEPATGTVVGETKLDATYFGEGSTHYVDPVDGIEKIAVLTWRERTIVVLDAATLEVLETVPRMPTTTGEGWGIAFDSQNSVFCVSDGSEHIHFWTTDFEEVSSSTPKVRVHIDEMVTDGADAAVMIPRGEGDDSTPVTRLNELEWDAATGTLLANVWFENVVVRIRPSDGLVTRVYDFSGLAPGGSGSATVPPPDVFNGIAIVPGTGGTEWLVTGKYWPSLYRVRIRE